MGINMGFLPTAQPTNKNPLISASLRFKGFRGAESLDCIWVVTPDIPVHGY